MTATRKRVCLLTGASGLLGAEFVRLYGHRYDIAAISQSRIVAPPPTALWEIEPLDPGVRRPVETKGFATLHADLQKPSDVARVAEFALDRFKRVDLVVNAAAMVGHAPLMKAGLNGDGLLQVLNLNAVAPLRLAAELAERFWRHNVQENKSLRRGIVNVSSTSSAYVISGAEQGAYSASKAALNMLTCHMAEEFSSIGVRVNAVAPDSFPSLIPTMSVCDAIARIDGGSQTGEIVMLEPEGETVL